MATVTITYEIQQTTPAPDVFTVSIQVLDAVNIDRQIFVFDSVYQAFTGVATVYDMRTWPTVLDPNLMSFRAYGVVRNFATIDEATAFTAYTRSRIEDLRIGWQTFLDAYPEDTVVVTPST